IFTPQTFGMTRLKSGRKRFMRTRMFKNARIVRAANGDWRVVYEYQLPGQTGKFRKFYVRDGINYIHDPEEKELAAQQLREDIDYAPGDPLPADHRTGKHIKPPERTKKANTMVRSPSR
ncbi:hypothetical protein, partial [Sphingobacterium sp.]|uniref:hypothetical protein n=1 Tax=Sphingobacterium sp. TaxID=341027 RepID=UPI00289630F0